MQKLLIIFSLGLTTHTSIASSLKRRIHQEIKRDHVAISYQEVKKLLFSTVENINGIVCSVYTEGQCQARHHKDYERQLKKRPKRFKINIEHTWPQSKGAKKLPANSDMHHLFITSKESNSKRANLPFCNVDYPFWEFGGSAKGIDINSQDCFEPRDIHKGNVARAMFYFSVRYMMPIDSDQESVLRIWNNEDPVDQREIERNNIIKSIQGNSNPFILEPNLLLKIEDF